MQKNNARRGDGETAYLLPLNLQFFADGEGGEKTEEATPKKLNDAREKGQVAKSRELVMALQLIAAFILLQVYVSTLGSRFMSYFRVIYVDMLPDFVSMNRDGLTVQAAAALLMYAYLQILICVAPFLLVMFVVGFLGNSLQFSWKVSAEPMKPQLSKLNPLNGFKRIFSKQALFELAKAIVKVILIFVVAYITIRDEVKNIFILYDMSLFQAVEYIGRLIINVGLRISIVYLIIALVDLIYQRHHFKEEMKMTKQEVKDEYKNTEGDPQIKGQQKARMREASRRRMMQAVPQADVVITNPEHVAVAIKYEPGGSDPPKVLAKGAEYNAQRIKEIAREHNVAIVQNKPLARSLYNSIEVGGFVTPELYEFVAEVLVSVYTANGRIDELKKKAENS